MHVLQGLQQPSQQAQHRRLRELLLLFEQAARHMRQISPAQIRHHVIRRAVFLKGIHQMHNVRVVQYRKLAGLLQERRQAPLIISQFPGQRHHHSALVPACIPGGEMLFDDIDGTAGILCQVGHAKTALRQLPADAVAAVQHALARQGCGLLLFHADYGCPRHHFAGRQYSCRPALLVCWIFRLRKNS